MNTVLRRRLPHLLLLVVLCGLVAVGPRWLPLGGWWRAAAALLLPAVIIHAIRRRLRDVGVAALAGLALVALMAIVGLRVDLGPALRARAEAAGSSYVHRPMHIGRLGVHLWSGRFVVDDLVIEGLTPSDIPFFKARTVSIALPWWRILLRREILLEDIELDGWQMRVELLDDGRSTFPRFGSDQPRGPSRLTTTVRTVHAGRGEFTYHDVGAWTTVASNLDVRVTNVGGQYRGIASVTAGSVRIKEYVPMRTDMRAEFVIRDGKVVVDTLDLFAGASHTVGSAEVDFRHWPEQIYRVKTSLDFSSMKDVFWAGESFRVGGAGLFVGAFRLFKGGYELKGDFTSDLATVNDLDFPALTGSLIWEPGRFAVTRAAAGFYGGGVRFSYSYAPLSAPTPAINRFDARYQDVDLGRFMDFLGTKGLRLDGRATGQNLLEWPSGGWAQLRGAGTLSVVPPPGVAVLARTGEIAPPDGRVPERLPGPLPDHRVMPQRVAIGGEVTYRLGPEWIDLERSHIATEKLHVWFEGRTAYGERSRINFTARTSDLQEADRFLAQTITAFGSPTNTISLGGYGEFRGVMLNAFRDPRVEGRFVGDLVRAWDVEWGHVTGSFVVEDSYVDVAGARLTRDESSVLVDGRFSLGYPRRDGRDEIDARVHMTQWELKDLRHAFGLDDYPIDGRTSGEYHLYGRYSRPYGFGRMLVSNAVVYGEPIDQATIPIRFEGAGVRLDAFEMTKGTGTLTGAAYIGWDGRYSFNADGRRIPLESLELFRFPQAPLSGLVELTASGASTFAHPAYDIRARIDDLFLKDEGVGQVTGRLTTRDDIMAVEFEAASPRLAVSGAGRIARARTADAELTLRFTDTSLDPYVRAFQSGFSPFTSAVASGSLRIVGQLANPDRLLVEATVDRSDIRLFDYSLVNDGPLKIDLDRRTVRLKQVRFVGEDTRLNLSGTVSIPDDQIAVVAAGEANLAVLQAFFRDIRSSGRAALSGEAHGSLSHPSLSGFATIGGGRVRHFSLPHSIDEINGRISFSNGFVRLDDVAARVGGGEVRFGGQVRMNGYAPGHLAVTFLADDVQLRWPAGFRSAIDADLALVGTPSAPTLTGSVTVHSAVLRRRLTLDLSALGIAAVGSAASDSGPAAPAEPTTLPLRFDIRVRAPSALRIESNVADIVSSADLTLRGTYDRPLLFGRAEIERGWVMVEGKRYVVTRGTVDFSNPTRIEPVFDFEAETRVRAPGQTYEVDLRAYGTTSRLDWQLNSDPPLPEFEIISLMFGDAPDVRDAELRSLQNPNELRNELLGSRIAQLAASPLTASMNRAVEETFRLDTFQIRPSLATDASQRLNASARLIFGKRISERLYLTFSRSLTSASRDQIILLEYDQSDRLSWVLSQNEDNTYALDVRVRQIR